MDSIHAQVANKMRWLILMGLFVIVLPASATNDIQKACSDQFINVCSTSSTEKYCCVVGHQRCCDKKSYNEDQSKILALILQAEERAKSVDKNPTSIQGSSSKSNLKKALTICAACVFGIPLLICFLDFLINISQKFRQRMIPSLFPGKPKDWPNSVSLEEGQLDVVKGPHGGDKNVIAPVVISEHEETLSDDGASRSVQGPSRIRNDSTHTDLVPGPSNSEHQNVENNATTLSKVEIELLKAQCAKIFQDEKVGKLKLAETQVHSNSAHNLPHKYGRFAVEPNRACNSARTSPTFPQKGKRKSSLVTSQTMAPLVINDNHIEVMTLANRSNNNNSFHNHQPKNGGPWNYKTLPHSSSSDHFLPSEAPAIETVIGSSRKSESPSRNIISPLYSLEQKDSKPLSDHPKKDMFYQIAFESTSNSEDIEGLSQTFV